jgi:hypothetical protein
MSSESADHRLRDRVAAFLRPIFDPVAALLRRFNRSPLPIFGLVLLTAAGFVTGVLIIRMRAGHDLTTRASDSFDDPAIWFAAWTIAMGFAAAYWFAVFLPSAAWCWQLTRDYRAPMHWLLVLIRMVVSLGSIAIIMGTPGYLLPTSGDVIDLPDHGARVGAIIAIATVAGVPAIFGIIWVYLVVHDPARWSVSLPMATRVATLLRLRDELQRFLVVLGGSIGLAVLTTSIFRKLVLVVHRTEVEAKTFSYPPEIVVLYGLFFSVLIFLVYAPAHAALASRARVLASEVYKINSRTKTTEMADQLKKRAELVTHLGLKSGVMGSFQNGLVIVAPLLASLPTLLLES